MQQIDIRKWFCGKTAFITGPTGFLGSVLIEKVLRECDQVSKIYVLIRAEDDAELQERFHRFSNGIVFNRIRETKPNSMQKLHPVRGDLAKLKLGCSENDINHLSSEVQVIVHAGASVKFDEDLENTVLTNVRGTREVLNLAKVMVNLDSFVYVSTAHSNCNLKYIEEKLYTPLFDPQSVIDICEEGLGSSIEQEVLKIYPNPHIFSKQLAENLVFNLHNELPVCIVRPSIITPACADPYPGWVDSNQSSMKLLHGVAIGAVRAAHGNRWNIADFIPVDFAANAIVVAAVNVGQHKIKKCPVYNFVASVDAPISWNQVIEGHKEIILQNPFAQTLWYPGGTLYKSFYCYLLFFVVFQLLPSIVCDFFSFILRGKTNFVSFQINTFQKLRQFSYFMNNNWRWNTENSNILYNKIRISERHAFNFRTHYVNHRKYFKDWHYGTRKYLLNTKEHAEEKDLFHLKVLYYLHWSIQTIIYTCVIYWTLSYFGYGNSFPFLHAGSCGACSGVRTEFQENIFKI